MKIEHSTMVAVVELITSATQKGEIKIADVTAAFVAGLEAYRPLLILLQLHLQAEKRDFLQSKSSNQLTS